jgi:hypothetical protein
MKKTSIIALVLLLCASVSNAQLRFGITAGTNISSLSSASSVIDEVKGATNYQVGILLQAKSSGFAIQPEILYSVKAGQFNNSTVSGILSGSDTKYQSQNIEIPVNLQFGISAGPARVFIQGGPYVSFLTGALVNGSVKEYKDVKDNINTFNYGVGAGVGAELLSLQLTVKYDWGLSKLGQEQLLLGQNINPFNELKDRNLSIALAYLF